MKKGSPSWTHNDIVMGWQLSDNQDVPAIEQSRITVIKFPVDYYQYFHYSPEAMSLRPKRIVELGWSGTSFDLPRPPILIGEYSLFSDAIKKVSSVLKSSRIAAKRYYPSIIEFALDEHRQDYCILYFNHYAYEFYHLFFILGIKSNVFENVPNPKINTLNQMLRWARSFEFKRRKLYKEKGFTWKPNKQEYPK